MSEQTLEMSARDAVELVQLLCEHHIDVCVDGGWAVDALLGKQTRVHTDLDIAIPHADVPLLRQLLQARGYTDVPRNDTRDCNFVMGDAQGRQVDVHTYTFDPAGNLTFGIPYPYDSLHGSGMIESYRVKCITPAWLVRFHTGYPLDENDYHDVRLLGERFGIPIPGEYHAFENKE